MGLFVWVTEQSGKFHNLGLTQRQLLRAQDGSKRINAGHVIVGALAQFIHSPAAYVCPRHNRNRDYPLVHLCIFGGLCQSGTGWGKLRTQQGSRKPDMVGLIRLC